MNVIAESYFLINFIGAIYFTFVDKKSRKAIEPYDLSVRAKFVLLTFTFIINLLVGLPIAIIKPLCKKG